MTDEEEHQLFKNLGTIETKIDMLLAAQGRVVALEEKVAKHGQTLHTGGALLATFVLFKDVILQKLGF